MANGNGTNGNGKSIINAKNIGKLLSLAAIYFAYKNGIGILWIAGLVSAGGFLCSGWLNGNNSNSAR